MALRTVGALRWPFCFLMPSAIGLWSTKPLSGSWQVEQETESSADRRLSLNSFSPRAATSGTGSFPGGTLMA